MWGQNKFKAKRINLAGRSFASKNEANCYTMLKNMEAAGEIKDLKCQVSVYLTAAKILSKPDFKYFDVALNQEVWAEYKGFETDVWRIKRRLWMFYGPGILRVYKGSGDRIRLHEEITPKELPLHEAAQSDQESDLQDLE